MQSFRGLPRAGESPKKLTSVVLIASASWIVAGCNGSSGGPVVIPTPFTFPQPEVRE